MTFVVDLLPAPNESSKPYLPKKQFKKKHSIRPPPIFCTLALIEIVVGWQPPHNDLNKPL